MYSIIGSTPPEDFQNPHVSSINDIQLLKMHRVSSKSPEEQTFQTGGGANFIILY